MQLHDRLAEKGAALLVETLDRLEQGRIKATPQSPELASYAPMLKKSDGELDWSRSSRETFNRVRAFNPWPGTFTYRGRWLLRILKARPVNIPAPRGPEGSLWRWRSTSAVVSCGRGSLELLEVQPENHKPIPASDFLNGLRLKAGQSILLGR